MKLLFPCFYASCRADCSVQNAVQRIMEIVSSPCNDLKLIRSDQQGNPQLTVRAYTGYLLYTNSFLPEMEIRFTDTGAGTHVDIAFTPVKSVRVLGAILYGVLFLFLAGFSFAAIFRIVIPWAISFPLGMMLVIRIGFSLGLRISSGQIWKLFYNAIVPEQTGTVPSLHT